MKVFNRTVSLLVFFTFFNLSSYCQPILNRNISLEVNSQRLDNVLEIMSNKGDFYFSYNSNIIKKDSLVTLTVYNKTVKQVLDFLFTSGFEYKESGNYIIIRRVPVKISLITNKAITEDKIYTVSGYVLDDESGEKISNASIYEKRLLASALTNEDGYFKIRIKSRNKMAALTVSKEFYQDTTVTIEPRYNQQVTITITPLRTTASMVTVSPEDYRAPDSLTLSVETDSAVTEYLYVKKDSARIEKTIAGMFLLSTKQKIRSLNLKSFFTDRPFQVSFTPGLGTHGKLGAQIINNFSLNILGGYSGGLNGIELGGLFNLNKKDVQFFQAAGLFNLTGGSLKGVQLAGITNTVLNGVTGWQAAGISNFAGGAIKGGQVAGIYNHAGGDVKGVQVAGISNFANKESDGLQIAGIANFSGRQTRGMQIAGIFNYSKKLHGVQIGLINISDTSDGLSIGLLNFVNKGYHKISLYTNEVLNANINLKTGNSKLYSMLIAGINAGDSAKIYSFGYGLGHDFIFSRSFSVSTTVSSQYLYLGSWNNTNLLNRFSLDLNYRLTKNLHLFAGPAFNVYYSDQPNLVTGYKKVIPSSQYHVYHFSNNVNGWIGWTAGITFF